MLTQFGATAESLTKASAMVFRIGSDAHLYDDPDDVSILPLLDSKFDSEKCEALKRLLALIAQGIDVSSYFPQVVKNVASQSLEVKKLVYLYLLHYAEKRPNETLLSINYFQKDLGHPNALVRAWSLRTMAGIRLHVIAPLVVVAVEKCARDPSVYVRKCAATALPKLHDLRLEEHISAIEEIIGLLLKDNSPGVAGAAAAAFASICPNNLALIGQNYKRLCETLPDVEEWGQIILIGILLRYVIAKHGIVQESIMLSSKFSMEHNSGLEDIEEASDDSSHLACTEIADIVSISYLEGPEKYLSKLSRTDIDSTGLVEQCITSAKSNQDVKLFLQCTSPLLWSYNSAVVLAAAGVHWIMASKEDISKVVKPLLFLLRSSSSSRYVVLCNIQVFAKAMPSLFAPYFEDFFISSSDSYQIKALKLEILSSIATYSSISSIFLEFQDYIRDPERRFAADAVAAIGLCTQKLPDVAKTCLEGLLVLALSESSNRDASELDKGEIVLVQAIKSIITIIKRDPPSHEKSRFRFDVTPTKTVALKEVGMMHPTLVGVYVLGYKVIVHLVRKLDSILAPAARAIVIWMVGEYNNIGELMWKMIPTLLGYLAWRFRLEEVESKLQIINAVIKVLLNAKEEDMTVLRRTMDCVFELAKCDSSYDVRDRARSLKKFLALGFGVHGLEVVKDRTHLHALADCIFGKPMKPTLSEPFSYRFYLPGSLSQIVLHAAPGYEPLPKPCSLSESTMQGTDKNGVRADDSESNEIDDFDSGSGSLDEENESDCSSQVSASSSSDGGGSCNDAASGNLNGQANMLIHLSDSNQIEVLEEICASGSADIVELMPKGALESWLNEKLVSDQHASIDQGSVQRSFARISIKDIHHLIEPKSYTLLDPTNGNGLSVDYAFSSEVSSISPQLVCLRVSFRNHSSEPLLNILLSEEDSNENVYDSDQSVSANERFLLPNDKVPTLSPMEEIVSLEPRQAVERDLQVCFKHHLRPLKLVLRCNNRNHLVKLRPNIGHFLKPLPMDVETFLRKESQLPGMFEYFKSCTFTDHISQLNDKDDTALMKDKVLTICEMLVQKMLSNAWLHLVSVEIPVAANLDDLSGLCLRFSGEILSNSIPCLITLTIQGTCSESFQVSVKINCEQTVFGLNLLNRIANFLADPTV